MRVEESQNLRRRLREQWGITRRWWVPFDSYDLPYEVLVLNSKAVRDLLSVDTLRLILATRDLERVYELCESNSLPDREMSLDLWDPYQGSWTERYWLSKEMDWLFYTTHENSTTIAGDWLLNAIKAAWPNWEAHQWVAPWRFPAAR
jgi:hypothetical protein